MKRFRSWISARLGRRLVFSHFLVIVLSMLVLQLVLATVVALVLRGTMPIEGEAGWSALSFAQVVSWLIENEKEDSILLTIEMIRTRTVGLPEPDEEETGESFFYISTSQDWIDRLIAVTVLDESGEELAVSGESSAKTQYPIAWQSMIDLAFSDEINPYKLSRLLTWEDVGLLLGTSAIRGENGEILGVVIVEMSPSLHLKSALQPHGALVGFLASIFLTSLLGVPVLLLVAILSIISGLVVSRSLSRRLKTLEDTAQQMTGGNLSLRISEPSPDEIGQVGDAFNQMAEQLEKSLADLATEKEQVETLLEARRDLVATVSHDLRTPVASLSAHLETLSTHPERLEEYLPILNDDAERITYLIDDLFELSRLDSHELNLSILPTSLVDVINKVVAGYKSLAWEKYRIVLETNIPEQLPPVQADPQRVEQILGNLISNGLRFTAQGGVVTIEAEALDDDVEVRVSDTGEGISTENLPLIFERFYRGDLARSRSEIGELLGSGSGLGLAIVKGLVEAMNGSVDAHSTLGVGTCISFCLPISQI